LEKTKKNTEKIMDKIISFKFKGLLNKMSTSKKTIKEKIMIAPSRDLDIIENCSIVFIITKNICN